MMPPSVGALAPRKLLTGAPKSKGLTVEQSDCALLGQFIRKVFLEENLKMLGSLGMTQVKSKR